MKTIDQIQKIKAVVEYILQHFNNGVDFPRLVEVTNGVFVRKNESETNVIYKRLLLSRASDLFY